jgi:hypothetical protein
MPTLPIITAALSTGNANLARCIRWICQKGREWESMGTPRATLGGHPYRHELGWSLENASITRLYGAEHVTYSPVIFC